MQDETIMKELMLIKTVVLEIKRELTRSNRVEDTPAKMLQLIFDTEDANPMYVSKLAHSFADQIELGRTLTDKQQDALINIYNGAKKWKR